MSEERTWARRALAAAVVVLVLTLLSRLDPPEPCGGLDARYAPILAFELVRSEADLAALFGPREGATDEQIACGEALASAMDRTNLADLAVFMPAYGLFVAGFFASHRARSPHAARSGIALVVIAVVFDGLEDASLLVLSHARDATSLAAIALPWTTGVKWISLGLAAIPEAVILREGGPLSKLGAAMALLALPGTLGAMIAPAELGRFVALAVVLAWLPCLVSVAARSRRPT